MQTYTDKEIIEYFWPDKSFYGRRANKPFLDKNKPGMWETLYTRFKDITEETTITEIVYRVINKIEEHPLCPVCGNKIPYKNAKYNVFCSKACQKSDLGKKIWQENMTSTLQERYGVTYALQSDELKERLKQNNIEKYGVENVYQAEHVKEKIKETNKERYGTEHAMQSDAIKEKMVATNHERYYSGTDEANALKEERFRKSMETCMEHYGVDHPMHSEELRAKWVAHNLEKYGKEYFFQTDEYKEIMSKKFDELGIDSYMQLSEVKAKVAATCMEKYGTKSFMETAEFKAAVEKYKKVKFKSLLDPKEIAKELYMSVQEYNVLCYLIDLFGKDDLSFNTRIDDRYPFNVDFYVKSKDLFIEINAHWSHNTHPYNPESPDDVAAAAQWKEYSQYNNAYTGAIDVWTVRDPLKIATAQRNNLNYLMTYGRNNREILNQIRAYVKEHYPELDKPVQHKILYSQADSVSRPQISADL